MMVVDLTVGQWHAIAQQGAGVAVTVCLAGDSMRPFIRRGTDRVTIVPVTRALRRGDVVLFERGDGSYVVHRVRFLKDGFVQTLGDACWNPDGWMPMERVLGLAARFVRNGRVYTLDCSVSRLIGRVWMAALPLRLCYRRALRLLSKIKAKVMRG